MVALGRDGQKYGGRMLACAFCSSVPSPAWFSAFMPVGVVAVGMCGLVLAYVAITRLRGRAKWGAIVVSLALAVAVPSAALTVRAGRTSVEVVTVPPPMDASAWRVACDSALQADGGEGQVDGQFVPACAEATTPWRWLAYALAGSAVALTLTGSLLLVSSRRVKLGNVAFSG